MRTKDIGPYRDAIHKNLWAEYTASLGKDVKPSNDEFIDFVVKRMMHHHRSTHASFDDPDDDSREARRMATEIIYNASGDLSHKIHFEQQLIQIQIREVSKLHLAQAQIVYASYSTHTDHFIREASELLDEMDTSALSEDSKMVHVDLLHQIEARDNRYNEYLAERYRMYAEWGEGREERILQAEKDKIRRVKEEKEFFAANSRRSARLTKNSATE